jgi:hypothetical protein
MPYFFHKNRFNDAARKSASRRMQATLRTSSCTTSQTGRGYEIEVQPLLPLCQHDLRETQTGTYQEQTPTDHLTIAGYRMASGRIELEGATTEANAHRRHRAWSSPIPRTRPIALDGSSGYPIHQAMQSRIPAMHDCIVQR